MAEDMPMTPAAKTNSASEPVLEHNLLLHNQPGYADFYDRSQGFIVNPWEQRIIRGDLDRILTHLPPDFSALDVGAGTGHLTLRLLERGGRVLAIDPAEEMLRRLVAKARQRQFPEGAELRVHCAPAERYLANSREQFHLVTFCSVLHHLQDYIAVVAMAADLVRPGGFLYIAHEPLHVRYAGLLARAVEAVDAKWAVLEQRLGLSEPDPYWQSDCLADYWQQRGGIDPGPISRVLHDRGFRCDVVLYDSKRHRLSHWLAELLGLQRLFRMIGRRT